MPVRLLFLVLVSSGCAGYQKVAIDSRSAAALNGQTTTYTARKMPGFALCTADNMQGCATSPLTALVAGRDVLAKNNVPDPTAAIAIGLAKALQDSYGTRPANSPVLLEGDDDPSRVAAIANGSARFVIDVKTLKWIASWSTPFSWTSGYKFTYMAGARLIDVQTKAVVAEGSALA